MPIKACGHEARVQAVNGNLSLSQSPRQFIREQHIHQLAVRVGPYPVELPSAEVDVVQVEVGLLVQIA